jgi:hypothetical protein
MLLPFPKPQSSNRLKCLRKLILRKWYAGIHVSQYEAKNPECVPVLIVPRLRLGVKVKPQRVDVNRQETGGEQGNKTLRLTATFQSEIH